MKLHARATRRRRARWWSAVLLAGLSWATPVRAASGPAVSLTGPAHPHHVAPGAAVAFTAQATLGGPAEYQFWVEDPNGQWVVGQNYSPSATFTLHTPTPGDYLVVAYALPPAALAAGDWAAAVPSPTEGVFVDSTVSLQLSATTVPTGGTLVATATDQNLFDPQYQFWVRTPAGTWISSGAYRATPTFTIPTATPGTYTVIAYAKSPLALNTPLGACWSTVATATVTADPVVQLTAPTAPLIADGQTTATLTATLTLPDGSPLTYSGPLTVTSSNPAVLTPTQTTVPAQNGVATVPVQVGTTPGTATLTVTGAGATGSRTLAVAAPTVSRVALKPPSTPLAAGGTGTLTVVPEDQAGHPFPTLATLPPGFTVTLASSDPTRLTVDGAGTATVQTWTVINAQVQAQVPLTASPTSAGAVTLSGSAGGVPVTPVTVIVGPAYLSVGWGYFNPAVSGGAWQDLRTHGPALSVITPDWYWLTGTGQLTHYGGLSTLAPQVVAQAHQEGVAVWPSLGWAAPGNLDLLRNPTTVAALVQQAVQIVTQGGYDGLALDFEGMGPANATTASDPTPAYQVFTQFVQTLAQALHARGKLLMVAVYPTSYPNSIYDYPALAQAANYLDVMFYGESDSATWPGPTAGTPWFTTLLQQDLAPASTRSRSWPASGRTGTPARSRPPRGS